MERPKLPERLQRRKDLASPPSPAVPPPNQSASRKPFPAPSAFPPLTTSKSEPEPALGSSVRPVQPPEQLAAPAPQEASLTPLKAAQTADTVLPRLSDDDNEAVNFMRMRRQNRKTVAKKEAKRWGRRAVVASAVLLLPVGLILTLFQFHTIPSSSMSPTVGYEDFLVSFRFADKTPHTGDVVIFDGEGTDWGDELFLKRVVGVDGQQVKCCEDDKILIDGEPLQENYLMNPDKPASGAGFDVDVSEDSFFALGDNRNHSKDSRYFFTQSIPDSSVVAKPFLGVNLSEFRFYRL